MSTTSWELPFHQVLRLLNDGEVNVPLDEDERYNVQRISLQSVIETPVKDIKYVVDLWEREVNNNASLKEDTNVAQPDYGTSEAFVQNLETFVRAVIKDAQSQDIEDVVHLNNVKADFLKFVAEYVFV